MIYKKKLIEVALPLEAINKASAREKSIRHGHPSTLHLWWARRPLAAARAVIFAQMVDDPSAHPDIFKTEKAQEKERQRLFRIIEDLVQWENTTNEEVLQRARDEIWQSWRRNLRGERGSSARERTIRPAQTSCVSRSVRWRRRAPLEAQRLGLESYASDLNPVAVLICKAMIEIPPKFAGKPPVNPECAEEDRVADLERRARAGRRRALLRQVDARRGREAHRPFVSKDRGNTEMAKERPDLKPLVGKKLTVIAWLWARTVKSPNPAFAQVDVPLTTTFMLSTKAGKEAYVEPVIENGSYRFTVKVGKPKNAEAAKNGTKLTRGANFQCLMSGTPIAAEYIKAEGKAGRMSARLMAIVAEGDRGRVYLAPTLEHEAGRAKAKPEWIPEGDIPSTIDWWRRVQASIWAQDLGDIFTPRQLVALTTLSDLVQEAHERVKRDALAADLPNDNKALSDDGSGATAYAEAVAVYLSLGVSKIRTVAMPSCSWNRRAWINTIKSIYAASDPNDLGLC